MLYRWPDKDANETLDFTVDWTAFLNGDTITGANWYIVDADGIKTPVTVGTTVNSLVAAQFSHTTTTATIYLGGGIDNTTYTIVCSATTASGCTAERSVKLRIRVL